MAAENSSFELEVVEVAPVNKNACRKRKPNFSVQEIAVITQKFEENQAVLKSKFTNTTTNKLKQSVWEEMTIAVNAVGTAHRSIAEVKEKWTNLQRTAKHELSKFRKEQKKTGGGPPPKTPSPSMDIILELLKDTPSFSGLKGFETEEENLDMDTMSEATDLPISPLVTINEADISALQLPSPDVTQLDEISQNVPTIATATHTTAPTGTKQVKRKKVTSDDVLRLQYETLQCKKETLLLKKAKLELQIKLLEKEL